MIHKRVNKKPALIRMGLITGVAAAVFTYGPTLTGPIRAQSPQTVAIRNEIGSPLEVIRLETLRCQASGHVPGSPWGS